MVISSAAAANSMRRLHEAFERRNREQIEQQHQRAEENRRREEEQRRREEDTDRRREEELQRQHINQQKDMIANNHHRLSGTTHFISPQIDFSEKFFRKKEVLFGGVISFDGYEHKCVDGSSIFENGNHFVHKLPNGVTRTYEDRGSLVRLQREDLPDGRARVYASREEHATQFTDADCFLRYERDEFGHYKCYGEKGNYNKWLKTDEVTAEGTETADFNIDFSEKFFRKKEELFGGVISFDGYEYKCVDGSSIFENGNHFVHKLPNGVTRTYEDRGSLVRLQREDLPDGRARVYESREEYNTQFTDADCFLRYERDEFGHYKCYGEKGNYNKWLKTDEVTAEGTEQAYNSAALSAQTEKRKEAIQKTQEAFDIWLQNNGASGIGR